MAYTVNLFRPYKIKSIEIKNRIWVSPMCQYSSIDGMPTDWHMVHLGSRAVGGAGLVMVEATGVSPEARISPDDSGIWDEKHVQGFLPITNFIKNQGAVPAIQLAHAGRKASTYSPWNGHGAVPSSQGGWQVVAPSAIPFKDNYPQPREMSRDDMQKVIYDFEEAAKRSLLAGFQAVEIHMAHGYLMHQFLSPLSNHRTDKYGGTIENRMRFPLEIVAAVRKVWPDQLPLFARISATDWAHGEDELAAVAEKRTYPDTSWTLANAVVLAKELKKNGVDLIDCSTGGILAKAQIPTGPGYQVPFAEVIRRDAKIPTGAVGSIVDPVQAEGILVQHQADAIFMAREFLRDPYWPRRAARELGVTLESPKQYGRAW